MTRHSIRKQQQHHSTDRTKEKAPKSFGPQQKNTLVFFFASKLGRKKPQVGQRYTRRTPPCHKQASQETRSYAWKNTLSNSSWLTRSGAYRAPIHQEHVQHTTPIRHSKAWQNKSTFLWVVLCCATPPTHVARPRRHCISCPPNIE
jgi:hypothetical protein